MVFISLIFTGPSPGTSSITSPENLSNGANKHSAIDAEPNISSALDNTCTAKLPTKCDCCKGDIICQPTENTLKDVSSKNCSKTKTKIRCAQVKWFTDFPWLTFCSTRAAVFCHFCRLAKRQQLITFSKNSETAFTDDGFANWKKATSRFREHESCKAHSEAVMKLTASQDMSVCRQLL